MRKTFIRAAGLAHPAVSNNPQMKSYRRAPYIVLVATLAACGDSPVEPGLLLQTPWPDVRDWVSGSALASLDGAGHFVFPAPEPGDGDVLLTPTEARAAAVAYVDTYVRNDRVEGNLAARAEEEHGGRIDWDRLEPLANAPFYGIPTQLTPEDMGADIANYFGPQYFMLYEVDGVISFVQSIAARATYLDVRGDGMLTGLHANEFTTDGVPRTGTYPTPMTAEHAVMAIASRAPVTVTEVPRYILPPSLRVPSLGHWMLVLDRGVTARLEEGGLIEADTLYVRHDWIPSANQLDNTAAFFVPGPQPDSIEVVYPVLDAGEPTLVYDTLATNPDAPIRFLRVFPIAN